MTTKNFCKPTRKNLNKTIEFFTKLGFKFNPQFTDENATCMIIGENIFVMLLIEKFFKTFTKKQISVYKLPMLMYLISTCHISTSYYIPSARFATWQALTSSGLVQLTFLTDSIRVILIPHR